MNFSQKRTLITLTRKYYSAKEKAKHFMQAGEISKYLDHLLEAEKSMVMVKQMVNPNNK